MVSAACPGQRNLWGVEWETMNRYILPRFGRHSVLCRKCGGRCQMGTWPRLLFDLIVYCLAPRAAWPYRLVHRFKGKM